MAKIDKKTVDWVCKIMREDALKNRKNDNQDLGYLPSAIRVSKRLTKGFMNIPKKDLHNKNKRAVFLADAMICADTMLESFFRDWSTITSFEANYYNNVDEE